VDRSLVAALAMVGSGGLIAMQAPINSKLGKAIGSLPAASVSFAVGLAALVTLTVLFAGGLGELGEARHLSWYYLTGGILGAVYVTAALISVRTLGAGGVTAATISGQLALSVVIDRFGLLGVAERGLAWQRVAGVALLAVGTFLVVRH
jgi:bacterial/archaeal transporter family-2 protein